MSTYVEIVVPWRPGPEGYAVPMSETSVRRAVDVAFAFIRPDLVSSFIEQPPAVPAALAVKRAYGQHDIQGLRTVAEEALSHPEIVAAQPMPHMWVVNGCTLSTYHPPNDAQLMDLMVTIQLPVNGNAALARLLNEDRGGLHVDPLDSGWEVQIDELTVRVLPLEPADAVDYHDLYAEDALDHPYRWVSSVGRNTFGLGGTLYASAPVVRQWTGGFLDFFVASIKSVRSPRALAHAMVSRPHYRLWPWLITRSSVLEGWVALPHDIAAASADAVIAYLCSPTSRNAGWIDMRQRLLADPDKKNLPTPLNAPEHSVRVIDAMATRMRGVTVTIQIGQGSAPGLEPWWWIRLSTDRRVYVDSGPTSGEVRVRKVLSK